MSKPTYPATPPARKSRYVLLEEETVNQLIDAKLTAAQYRTFLYFSLADPFGNRFVDASGKMARQRLGIGKSTYYDALAALQHAEFFEFEDVSLRVRSKIGSKSPEKLSGGTIVPTPEIPSEIPDAPPRNRTSIRKIERHSEILDSPPLEPSDTKASRSPQYRSIDLNQIHSSSKREREKTSKIPSPEKVNKVTPISADLPPPASLYPDWTGFAATDDPPFFDFVLTHRVPRLPQPPASPQCVAEGWIRKDGDLLYAEYQDWADVQAQHEKLFDDSPSPPEQLIEPPESSVLPELTRDDIIGRLRGAIATKRPISQRLLDLAEQWQIDIASLQQSPPTTPETEANALKLAG
ncbi:MAG: hypothetical protein AAFY78_22895 [Cyanobacteria bacterium J06648_16]